MLLNQFENLVTIIHKQPIQQQTFSPSQPFKCTAMATSFAGPESDRTHQGRRWSKGKGPYIGQCKGTREIRR